MRRSIWIVATLLTFLLTTIVLARSGWFQARSATIPRVDSKDRLESHDPLMSEAAWRWQHCQPAHWRACVLQRQ
jgi:hypothetical protein